MDPMTQLFGRRPFTGTGRVEDYFSTAPDLSFLQTGQDILPPGSNYDPSLDPEALLAEGYDPDTVQQAQALRMHMHAREAQRRINHDGQGALSELNKIDPSRESFSKDLLKIFQKYPNADKSPEFKQRLALVGELTKIMPPSKEGKMFKLSQIEDPEIRALAMQEKWDALDEESGMIRANDAAYKKKQKIELVKAGYSPQEIADMDKRGELTDIGVLYAASQRKAKPERTLTPEAAGDISKLFRAAKEAKTQRGTVPWKLQWIQDNLLPAEMDEKTRRSKTDFPKSAWDQAYQASLEPSFEEQEMNAYMSLMSMTPGQIGPAAIDMPIPGKQVPGMRKAGTVDFFNRPVLDNKDGTTSTASTMIVGLPEGEVLIPTVINGKRLSEDDAIKHYQQTGEHFGIFETPQQADAYDKVLHKKLAESPQAKQSVNGVITVNSKAEYDALPSGAKFIDATGQQKTKK